MDQNKKKFEQAENLLQQRRYCQAIKLLKDVHEAFPEEEPVLLMLAWAYYDSGDAKRAEECFHELFERELKRKIFTGFAYDELVRIYKQERNFSRLVEVCQKAVAFQPEDINLLGELASAYLHTGRAKEACGIYEKMIKLEEDNPAIYCLWGEALFAAGLIAESEDVYSRAGEMDPEEVSFYYFKLASLFQQAQNHQEAKRIIKRCLVENPDNPLYYCFLGDSLIGLNQIKEACEAYDKAVQCGDHKSAGVYYNRLGNSLMKAQHFPEAAESFGKAVEHDEIPAYYFGLISAYRAMGLEDKAQKLIRRAGAGQKG